MDEINMGTEQLKSRWAIDMDWFERNNRSFKVLAQSSLCHKCSQRLKSNTKDMPTSEIMSLIKKCCSKTPDYLNSRLPILESVFKLLLAGGNQPLELEKIVKQLSERGVGIYRISTTVLYNLMNNDQYYGLNQI